MGLTDDLNQIAVDTQKLHDVVHGIVGELIETENGDLITVATALNKITQFTPQGDWVTATVYERKDLVLYDDVLYVVIEDHTSGVFATDFGNNLLAIYQNINAASILEEDLASTIEGLGIDLIGNGIKKVNGIAALRLSIGANTPIIYLSYHTSAGDGGQGVFVWDASSSASDNNGTIILPTGHIGNGRWIRQFNIGSDRMFGAKYDGVTDDTDIIQACANYMASEGKPWVAGLGGGTAMIDAVTKNINIPSNTHVAFVPGAEWKAITNSSDSYIIMDIRDVTDIKIYNPVITGDKDTHTGITGEQGHGINFSESDLSSTSNIQIHNPIVTKCWGDGIVIRKGSNINIFNAFCDDNRRNGITINKGIDINFLGTTTCSNTDGIAPEAGFDIEPNDATGELKRIYIENLITLDNAGPGLTFNIGDFPGGGVDKEVTVSIGRHEDNGSIYGVNVEKCGLGATETIQGALNIKEAIYQNTGSCGLYFNDYASTNTPTVSFDNLKIINPNILNSSSVQFGSGIAIDRKAGSGLMNNIGNLYINNLLIEDNRSANQMTRGVAAVDNDASGATLENFSILNPVKISGYDAVGDCFHIAMKGAKFIDPFFQSERNLSGSVTLTSRSQRRIKTSNASPFIITDGITGDNAGMPLLIESTGTGGITFDPGAARSIFPLQPTAGEYVTSTSVGALLEIELRSDNHWYILRQIGTWTLEP